LVEIGITGTPYLLLISRYSFPAFAIPTGLTVRSACAPAFAIGQVILSCFTLKHEIVVGNVFVPVQILADDPKVGLLDLGNKTGCVKSLLVDLAENIGNVRPDGGTP
jgi:hypothetical protein